MAETVQRLDFDLKRDPGSPWQKPPGDVRVAGSKSKAGCKK
jgi:hypothetical protein